MLCYIVYNIIMMIIIEVPIMIINILSPLHSSEPRLLPPVLLPPGPVDHPSLRRRAEVPEGLRRPPGPALRSEPPPLPPYEPLLSRTHSLEPSSLSSPLTEAWFLFLTTSRWFALRLDGMCSIFVTITTFGCLLLRNREDSSTSLTVSGLLLCQTKEVMCVCVRAGRRLGGPGADLLRHPDGDVPVGSEAERRGGEHGELELHMYISEVRADV